MGTKPSVNVSAHRLALGLVMVCTFLVPAAHGSALTCNGQPATIVGTDHADRIIGTDGPDVIVGLGGYDHIQGGGGDDVICGGMTKDELEGGPGNDWIAGGHGPDEFDLGGAPIWTTSDADDGNDTDFGGRGDDVFYGSDGNDSTHGGVGSDTYYFYRADAPGPVTVNLGEGTASGWGDDVLAGVENVIGSPFGDVLIGDDGPNVLGGAPIGQNDGSDSIFGNGGDDRINDGIFGNDYLNGGAGDDLLEEGIGDDELLGGTGVDTVSFPFSENGVNVDLAAGIASGQGTDDLTGIENVIGTDHSDSLNGDENANTLDGLAGQDSLNGRAGDDRLIAADGQPDDTVDGALGNDTCEVDVGDVVLSCETTL
jgi:Ca2+-binding RTX toxin-like protein